jgi:predicted transglutaminase-like cysteine proteinase
MVKTILDSTDYESFKKQFIELQNKHFAQNSKVTSLLISFTSMNSNLIEAQNLNRLFEQNIRYSTLYMRNIDDYVKLKYCTSNPDQCKQTDDKKDTDELENNINETMLALNRSYNEIIGLMQNEIRRSENENDKFRF